MPGWMLKYGFIAASVVAGVVIGWFSGSAGPAPVDAGTPVSRGGRQEPVSRARWSPEEFKQAAKAELEKELQPHLNPLEAGMAEWTDAELRAALNESLTDPDFALPNGGGDSAVSALLGEWMKRDFKAVMAWFDSVESRTLQEKLSSHLTLQWPVERAEEGLDFVIAHREWFSDYKGWAIAAKCVTHQAEKGPLAVADMIRKLRELTLDGNTGNRLELPDGFDFLSLVKQPVFRESWEGNGLAKTLMKSWFAQNREEAFAWTLEDRGAAALADDFARRNLTDDQLDHEWFGGKFAAMNGQQQEEVINSCKEMWIFNPRHLITFTKEIHDPEVLARVRGIAAQSIFAGKTMDAMPVIESIPGVEQRLELLESATPDPYFNTIDRPRRFDEVSETQLRKKLAEWQVGEARTEAIVSRYKQ